MTISSRFCAASAISTARSTTARRRSFGAFADDEVALQQATKQFSRLAYTSAPTLRQLNLLLPQLTRWSNTIAPQLDEIPATVRAAYPWIEQTNLLFGPKELGASAPLAQSTIENFAKTQAASQKLLPQLDNVSRCWNKIWYPTLNAVVPDGSNTSGKQNYKEFWYSLVGWNSSAQNYSSTGPFLRLGTGSASTVTTPSGALFGGAADAQTGVTPKLPSKDPKFQPKTLCYKNALPNLAPTTGSQTP
jgi:hypothetical protein